MNCPRCYYDNADNALFCANCGAKLDPYSLNPPAPNAQNNSELPLYGSILTPKTEQEPFTVPTPPEQPQQQPAHNFPTYGTPAPKSNAPYVGSSYPAPNAYSGQTFDGSYGNQPVRREGQSRDWAAITAFVCGILSLPCCISVAFGAILAVAAIVFGILGLKSNRKPMAIVGLCFGVVGLICSVIMGISVLMIMEDPAFMEEFLAEFESAMNV